MSINKITVKHGADLHRICQSTYVDPDVCGGPLFRLVFPTSPGSTTSMTLCLNHCAQLKETLPIGTCAPGVGDEG